ANKGILDTVDGAQMQTFKAQWFPYFTSSIPDVEKKLSGGEKPNEADDKALYDALVKFRDSVFTGKAS
ncbi:MAG: hypothetical protein K2X66_05395, partial [Cyanobacteria bacterium]|nr:hypothetical protein [Cyanobacteriota bacterium]